MTVVTRVTAVTGVDYAEETATAMSSIEVTTASAAEKASTFQALLA